MNWIKSRKKIVGIILAVLLIGGSYTLGFREGSGQVSPMPPVNLVNTASGAPASVDFSIFWKAWNSVNEKYVPTTGSTSSSTVTDQDRVYGAIKGMVDALGDPYTTFFPPAESQQFQSEISGNFEGVGMEIGIKDDVLTVIAALKNTPAERAGISPGDQILKINDTPTPNLTIDEAVNLIRGKKGTTVTFTLGREGKNQPIVVNVVRDVINIPTIDYNLRSDGIFIIHLYNFSANSPDLFRQAIQSFVKSGSKKLILDLRGNPGGYLEAAVDMASYFLPTGDVVVREDYGKGREEEISRSRGYNLFGKDLKMIILINKGSASASEILAGALSEHGVAKLVGEKSFGKGSVQELVNLTPETALKVTVARWLTPNGKSISENGLTPDYPVTMTQDDATAKRDPQLDKAVQLLNSR